MFLPVLNKSVGEVIVRVYRQQEVKRLSLEVDAWGYVNEIRKKYAELINGHKQVIILWETDNERMADVWVFGEKESVSAGAMVAVYLFRELEKYESPVVSAADGLVILGEEAKKL